MCTKECRVAGVSQRSSQAYELSADGCLYKVRNNFSMDGYTSENRWVNNVRWVAGKMGKQYQHGLARQPGQVEK
jgi:hypothetical protein